MREIFIEDQSMDWEAVDGVVRVVDVLGVSRLAVPLPGRRCEHLFTVDVLLWGDPEEETMTKLLCHRDDELAWVRRHSLEERVWDERATCLPCLEDELSLAGAAGGIRDVAP